MLGSAMVLWLPATGSGSAGHSKGQSQPLVHGASCLFAHVNSVDFLHLSDQTFFGCTHNIWGSSNNYHPTGLGQYSLCPHMGTEQESKKFSLGHLQMAMAQALCKRQSPKQTRAARRDFFMLNMDPDNNGTPKQDLQRALKILDPPKFLLIGANHIQ